MPTLRPTAERYLSGGTHRITQRMKPCNCGCQGNDPWHAKHVRRVVRDIVRLDEPSRIRAAEYGGVNHLCVAVGTYAHPAGPRRCALVVIHMRRDDTLVPIGWYRVDDDDVRTSLPTLDER